ncbi:MULTISPECIES: flagellar hook-basal body complex protein FliE [Vagococcus]|uniref:Flagellar hook-basal body complex protein FliE n=1 Tax=Vagococcus fluvialis bH819 TaxID=1255619 RepID=A0A1X6WRH1_9ENTE|nr:MULTISPECIES: flagellar hook-basal body complex protein FliE [Vagococcus]SLM86877.1 hypothetical protein FM121_12320 [Vagococcus fluvialis bH819]HCM88666.1 flagellar hook-basal body complex protein FliE [Vagococcus sp.]
MNVIKNNYNEISQYQNQLKDVMLPNENKVDLSNQPEFENFLSKAIDSVDDQVAKSSDNIPKLISGDLDNIHTAMIDMNKSQLVLQTAVQVRNKCVEAYNDVKNMQF